MKPLLKFPATPFTITQAWGVRNTAYDHFGFTRHNGVDFLIEPDGKVHAPHEGTVTMVGFQPQGAGKYIVIMSQFLYEFPDGNYYLYSAFFHLDHALLAVGDKVQAGDAVAIADNTGFSTGPHTHWAFQRYRFDGINYTNVDKNEANNTVDPMPFTEGYAVPPEDPQRTAIQKALIVALTTLKGLLERLVAQKSKPTP